MAMSGGNDRVALVTGASQGLGRSAAIELARSGFTVYAAARNSEALKELSNLDEVRSRIVSLTMDVSKEDSVVKAFEQVEKQAGQLDVLVNNAGVLVVGTVEMVSVTQAKELFDTNLFGAMRCMQAALGSMRLRKSGCIINVSTIFAEIPTMNQPVYAASKAALDALTLGTREAVKPFGISVYSLQPGGITDTSIGSNLKNGDRFEQLGETNPYPINDMVQESVFDRIVPNGQKSAEVAKIIVDMALGKYDVCSVQTSAYTEDLARKKLKDASGNAITRLRF